jgi:hypothetical protein
MKDLQELIDRMKAATGPDRELDFAVYDHLFPPKPPPANAPHIELPPGFGRDALSRSMDPRPELTGSIDAALALVERVLPGAEYNISTLYGHAMAELPINADNYLAPQVRRMDGNMPLAIIECALLAKLEEQADG